MEPERFYTVTELARELGVTPRTIRFYEKKELIAPQRAGTTRVYTHRDRARMILILRGKQLGFSLSDIKDYLDLYAVDTSQSEQVRLLLRKVRGRIGLLERQQQALTATLAELRAIEAQSAGTLRARGLDPDAEAHPNTRQRTPPAPRAARTRAASQDASAGQTTQGRPG